MRIDPDTGLLLRSFAVTFLVLVLCAAGTIVWLAFTGDRVRAALTARIPEATAALSLPEPGEKDAADPGSLNRIRILRPPVSGLHRQTDKGLMPVIREDGLTVFQAYRKPYRMPSGTRAEIFLVLVDYGLSEAASNSALNNLPPEVTFAISPFAHNAQRWLDRAIALEHEVWLGIGLEPLNYPLSDPGPNAILARATGGQNKRALELTLGQAAGYAGVIAYNDPIYIEIGSDFDMLLSVLSKRGVGLALSNTDITSGIIRAILDHNLAFAQNDIWLDKPPTRSAVQEALQEVEAYAEKNDRAVVFFQPYPATFFELLEWIDTLPQKGYQLAPLSAIAAERLPPAKH